MTKTFELPVTGLAVDGLRDGYSIQYNQDMFEIEVGGAGVPCLISQRRILLVLSI